MQYSWDCAFNGQVQKLISGHAHIPQPTIPVSDIISHSISVPPSWMLIRYCHFFSGPQRRKKQPSRSSTALSQYKIKLASQAALPLPNAFAVMRQRLWNNSCMVVHMMAPKFVLLRGAS